MGFAARPGPAGTAAGGQRACARFVKHLALSCKEQFPFCVLCRCVSRRDFTRDAICVNEHRLVIHVSEELCGCRISSLGSAHTHPVYSFRTHFSGVTQMYSFVYHRQCGTFFSDSNGHGMRLMWSTTQRGK